MDFDATPERGMDSRVGSLRGAREAVELWNPLAALMEPERDGGTDEAVEAIAEQIGELMGRTAHILDPESRMEDIAAQVREMIERSRSATLLALLRYLWHDARNPWEMMKRGLAVTRRIRPDMINGISQAGMSALLHETRAAGSAREMKVVEGFMRQWGVRGFMTVGGLKSESARRIFSERQKGNSSRKKGERRKKRGRRSAELGRVSEAE